MSIFEFSPVLPVAYGTRISCVPTDDLVRSRDGSMVPMPPPRKRILVTNNGMIHVFSDFGYSPELKHSYSSDGGESWTHQTITDGGVDDAFYSYDWHTDGQRIYMLYMVDTGVPGPDNQSTNASVRWRRTNVDGITWQPFTEIEQVLDTFTSGQTMLGVWVENSSRVHYVWTHAELHTDPADHLHQIRYSLNGGTPEVVVSTMSGYGFGFEPKWQVPSTVVDSTGVVWALWRRNLTAGSDQQLSYSRRVGGTWVSPTDIDELGSDYMGETIPYTVLPLTGGRMAAVYDKRVNGDPSPNLRYRRYNGSSWAAAVDVAMPSGQVEQDGGSFYGDLPTLVYFDHRFNDGAIWRVPLDSAADATKHEMVLALADLDQTQLPSDSRGRFHQIYWARSRKDYGFHGTWDTRDVSSKTRLWHYRVCDGAGGIGFVIR